MSEEYAESIETDTESDGNESDNAAPDFSKQLIEFSRQLHIKNFDYSQFKKFKTLGRGGIGVLEFLCKVKHPNVVEFYGTSWGMINLIYDNSIEEIIKTSGIEFYDFNEFSEFNKIGEGGFGQIESAYWKTRDITVALKSLKVKMNSNENVNEGFKREARLLAKISKDNERHPNVNQLYGVTKTKDENLSYGEANNKVIVWPLIAFSKMDYKNGVCNTLEQMQKESDERNQHPTSKGTENYEDYEDKSDKISTIKNKSTIEEIIKNSEINIYEYNDFCNFKKFGESKFSQILKADWKDNPTVVLKSLATNLESGEKQFIREINSLSKIMKDSHPNIIGFLGITKDHENDIGGEASTPLIIPKQIEDFKSDNLILNQIEEKKIRLISMCDHGFTFKENRIEKACNQAFKININEIEMILPRIVNYEKKIDKCKYEFGIFFKRNSKFSAILPRKYRFPGVSFTMNSKFVMKQEIIIPKSSITLTENFIKDVENALSATDKLIKLNEILGRYGHFCALRIAFGGAIIRIKNINKFSEQTKIIGGNIEGDTNSDLSAWTESLEDFRTWKIIEYSEICPLFDLLDGVLRNRVLEALGKRILKVKVDDITYVLGNQKKAHVHYLGDQLKDIYNIKDCQIFTSIMSQNDKYVFSTHIEYDEEYNPVVAIHHIKVQKKPIIEKKLSNKKKPRFKECRIQLGWIVVGYPENFDFDQTHNQFVIQSRKYPVSFSNNEYIVQLPYTTKDECILGTCVLEPSLSHFDTFVIGVHLEASRNSACLFVFDDNKPRTDKELLQSLKLFVCTISYKSSYQGEFLGQTAITWNNSQLKLSNFIDKINRKPNNFLTIIRKNIDIKKDDLFISPVFMSQLYNTNNCDKCHGIINITPSSIIYGPLNQQAYKQKEAQFTYFCVPP
ncbi:18229_t:CDS:10 [Gigaspora margarita]|uniref:18229_t:CDS:1 n=1 Tax=Gigaspora margarita TaxID=4874 RepID=A0ABM8VVH4_GIGMA|nr:18229_t:CDS:10 [Gigaspora margarita]